MGLNHRTAPLHIREKLSVTRTQLPEVLTALGDYVSQGVILCTCNRSEIYTLGPERHLEESLEEFLADYFDIALVDVERYLYSYRQKECIHHIFRVASGLDSMILGEGEILRQVRDAFGSAVQAGTASSPLSGLFHQALRVGKKVRRDTGISRNALSISGACVKLARQLLGDPSVPSGQALGQLRVMVIGAGEAGKLVALALKESGANGVIVTNRTYERAAELALELAGEAVPFQDMPDALRDVDIIISSTGSPGYVLEAEVVERAMATRPEKPLFLIDIAVPRDIDPASAQIGNVFLYNVDDLSDISETNRLERQQEAQRAEEMVVHEVKKFQEWYRTLDVIPTVTAMRKWADGIREREMAKLLRRLDHQLSPQEISSVEAMAQAIVNKILHNPTSYLKNYGNPDRLRLTSELFNLSVPSRQASGEEVSSATEQ